MRAPAPPRPEAAITHIDCTDYFQHLPCREESNTENGTDPTGIVAVHIEPLAIYANTATSVAELPEGALIAIPADASNGGRALALLQDAGLITLTGGVDVTSATEDDIADSPLSLEFVAVEAAQLPRTLEDVDAAVINGNYALEADLSPAEDAIASEPAEDNPYADYLVTTAANAENADGLTLADLLQSSDVKQYITDTWTDGSVVPAT